MNGSKIESILYNRFVSLFTSKKKNIIGRYNGFIENTYSYFSYSYSVR